MNILLIGAHPDDIEIGCCGLIQTKPQYNYHFLILSTGTNGGHKKNRIKEQQQSCKYLNIKKYHILNNQDGKIKITPKIFSYITNYINKNKIDLCLVHWPKDTHQDHRTTAELITSICLKNRISFGYYQSFSSYEFISNLELEINFQNKQNVLALFTSQYNKIITKTQYNNISYKKDKLIAAEHFYLKKYYF